MLYNTKKNIYFLHILIRAQISENCLLPRKKKTENYFHTLMQVNIKVEKTKRQPDWKSDFHTLMQVNTQPLVIQINNMV